MFITWNVALCAANMPILNHVFIQRRTFDKSIRRRETHITHMHHLCVSFLTAQYVKSPLKAFVRLNCFADNLKIRAASYSYYSLWKLNWYSIVKQKPKITMISWERDISLAGYTVIFPSVCVGNVAQLTVDLIISTLELKKVASIWHVSQVFEHRTGYRNLRLNPC